MFVVFNDVSPSWCGRKEKFPVYDTDNLEVEELSYDELVQKIDKFGADAFSDNVTDDDGDYFVEYRINVSDIPIDALDWKLNNGQAKYNNSNVSLEVDDKLDLVFKINGKSYILAHKPQAKEGVPKVHWNDFYKEFDEIKNYNKREVLEIDYVEAVSDKIIKFLLHYDDNRFIVTLDKSGNPLGLFLKNLAPRPRDGEEEIITVEYQFDSVEPCDNDLLALQAEKVMLKYKNWWDDLGLILQIPKK